MIKLNTKAVTNLLVVALVAAAVSTDMLAVAVDQEWWWKEGKERNKGATPELEFGLYSLVRKYE